MRREALVQASQKDLKRLRFLAAEGIEGPAEGVVLVVAGVLLLALEGPNTGDEVGRSVADGLGPDVSQAVESVDVGFEGGVDHVGDEIGFVKGSAEVLDHRA